MATARVKYLGELRTECYHERSGETLTTVAPPDNNGKGDAFSPTDLLATSLASCMITIIGIYCESHGYSFRHAEAGVNKIMASDPRRVSRIEINMDLSGNGWDETTRTKIIRAAEACPVAKSIHSDIELDFIYTFD